MPWIQSRTRHSKHGHSRTRKCHSVALEHTSAYASSTIGGMGEPLWEPSLMACNCAFPSPSTPNMTPSRWKTAIPAAWNQRNQQNQQTCSTVNPTFANPYTSPLPNNYRTSCMKSRFSNARMRATIVTTWSASNLMTTRNYCRPAPLSQAIAWNSTAIP